MGVVKEDMGVFGERKDSFRWRQMTRCGEHSKEQKYIK